MRINREKLEAELKKQGYTAKELAQNMDVHEGTITKYMNGVNVPTKRMYQIADFLNIDIFDLMDVRGFTY